MAKHQHYDYSQSVIAPIFLEDQLVPGTLEYAIHYIVEERLNMSIFDARYQNDNTGRKSIDPKLLMKIVLYCLLTVAGRLDTQCRYSALPGAACVTDRQPASVLCDGIRPIRGNHLNPRPRCLSTRSL
jgi:hypothetical protein